MAQGVDTKRVAGRRVLRFERLDEVLADARHVVTGPHCTLGNWTPGQIFLHLARSMDGSIDGFSVRAPWLIRLLGRLLKRRMLTKPMPPGFRLPDQVREFLPGATETEAGVRALEGALRRLEAEPQRAPHPVCGALDRDQWNQLHLRHAELHLSFIVPIDRNA